MLKHGAKDFISTSRMDFNYYENKNIDIHHIFPKNYCQKYNFPKEHWNSIINKTPLSARTNRIMSGAAPSIYIKKLISDYISEKDLFTAIESHKIDTDLLKSDNFCEFIIARAKSILNLISLAMKKEISDRDSEEVIKTFGRSLKQD